MERSTMCTGGRLPTHSPRPAGSLSYREFIECRYIGLFRISNSISYRTSHIEYLDILKTSDFFVFFRRKFQKFAENSPKIQKIRRKFRKFAENSSKRRSSLRPSYRIVSYRIEKKTLISYRYRIESKKSLSLLSDLNQTPASP